MVDNYTLPSLRSWQLPDVNQKEMDCFTSENSVQSPIHQLTCFSLQNIRIS